MTVLETPRSRHTPRGEENFDFSENLTEKHHDLARKSTIKFRNVELAVKNPSRNNYRFEKPGKGWIRPWFREYAIKNNLLEDKDFSFVAEGAYGAAFRINTPEAWAFIDSQSPKTNRVLTRNPKLPFLVKIQALYKPSDENSAIREDQILADIFTRKITLPKVGTLYGKDIVSELYCSWTAFVGPYKLRFSCQSFIKGKTLDNALLRSNFKLVPSLDVFVKLEKKLVTLWCLGFAHMDLHGGNIIVQDKDPVIIDLGFAVVLPDNLREQLAARVIAEVTNSGNGGFAKIFDELYKKYATVEVIVRKGFMKAKGEKSTGSMWLNPNSSVLKKLQNYYDPQRLHNARQRIWSNVKVSSMKKTKTPKTSKSSKTSKTSKPSKTSKTIGLKRKL
jgi:hypothetical protein